MTKKSKEQKLRRALNKAGYLLHKSRKQEWTLDDQGGYVICDLSTGIVVDGSRYDISLEDVEEFVSGLEEE